VDADNIKQKERETIQIVHEDSFRVINAADFDPAKHEKYPKAKAPKAEPKAGDAK